MILLQINWKYKFHLVISSFDISFPGLFKLHGIYPVNLRDEG